MRVHVNVMPSVWMEAITSASNVLFVKGIPTAIPVSQRTPVDSHLPPWQWGTGNKVRGNSVSPSGKRATYRRAGANKRENVE
jgi:hypothetical protein